MRVNVVPRAGTLSTPGAVGNFQMVRQGDTTNGSSSGTQNGATLTIGAFNYLQFDLSPGYAGQAWDCAAFTRAPPGDVTSHVNLSDIHSLGYIAAPSVGTWATAKIPLSVLMFSTPGNGITTFHGTIASGVLTVTSIDSGPGIDAPCWIGTPGNATTPGATAGVWVSATPGQTAAGTYTLTMGNSGTPPDVSTSTQFTARRTNFYKTAIKDVHGAINNNWFVNNIVFTRN
jgi:hypothetical protein